MGGKRNNKSVDAEGAPVSGNPADDDDSKEVASEASNGKRGSVRASPDEVSQRADRKGGVKESKRRKVGESAQQPKPSPVRKEEGNTAGTKDKPGKEADKEKDAPPPKLPTPTAAEILSDPLLESDTQRLLVLQAKYDQLVGTSDTLSDVLDVVRGKLSACKEMLRATCVKFYERERAERHAKLLEDTVRLGERPVYSMLIPQSGKEWCAGKEFNMIEDRRRRMEEERAEITEQRNILTRQHTKLRRDKELEERRATEALELAEKELREREAAEEAAAVAAGAGAVSTASVGGLSVTSVGSNGGGQGANTPNGSGTNSGAGTGTKNNNGTGGKITKKNSGEVSTKKDRVGSLLQEINNENSIGLGGNNAVLAIGGGGINRTSSNGLPMLPTANSSGSVISLNNAALGINVGGGSNIGSSASSAGEVDPATGMVLSAATTRALEEEHIFERREILNSRTEFLRREELELREMEQRFISERALHEKRLKLWSYERTSKYNHYPVFRDRYQLGNLLGKGGFSEVYKGVDLENTREIVLKIHEVGEEMEESEKEFYVRHAMREADIQKALNASSIVQLYDVISISENSFATVLEYCGSETLDDYLKGRPNGVLSEKEARGVVIQLMCGLKAMNRREEPIIHYDLKPSNLIYDRGTIKITDFGLSKIVRDNSDLVQNVIALQNNQLQLANGNISQQSNVQIISGAVFNGTVQANLGASSSSAAQSQSAVVFSDNGNGPGTPSTPIEEGRYTHKGYTDLGPQEELLTTGGRINDTKLTLNPKIRNTTRAEEVAIKTLKEREFLKERERGFKTKAANAPFPERECDLTSAGCGTYWYLPIECFPRDVDDDGTGPLNGTNSNGPVKVSNKVDVWSVGVILFEMLFGKRPFGHELSQVRYYHAALKGDENLQVEFPETPKVSKEAQDFIKRLLVPDPDSRPSVFEACGDVYLTKGKI